MQFAEDLERDNAAGLKRNRLKDRTHRLSIQLPRPKTNLPNVKSFRESSLLSGSTKQSKSTPTSSRTIPQKNKRLSTRTRRRSGLDPQEDRFNNHMSTLFSWCKALAHDRDFLVRHYKKQAKKELIPGISTLSIVNAILSNAESIIDGSWVAVKSVLFQKGTGVYPDSASSSGDSGKEEEQPPKQEETTSPIPESEEPFSQVIERKISDTLTRVNDKIKSMKGGPDEPGPHQSSDSGEGQSTSPEVTPIPQMMLPGSAPKDHPDQQQLKTQKKEYLSTGYPVDRTSSLSYERTSSISSIDRSDNLAYRAQSRSISQRSSSSSISSFSEIRPKRSLSTARSDSSNQSEYDSMSFSDSLSGYLDSSYRTRVAHLAQNEEDSTEGQDHSDSVKRPKDKKFYDILSKKTEELQLIPSLPIPKEVYLPDLASWKKRKRHKIILCLDGGGIRGIATTQFLLQLEQALGQNLSDVFDMVCGSSTGAILTGLIGGLGKSAEEAHKIYTTRENLKGIFPTTINWSLQGPKYGTGKGKTAVLSKYLGKMEMKDSKTHILISSYDISSQEPCIFTEQSESITLIDAINASSAAPTYFPPVEVSPGRWCIDGSIIASDLSICAFAEAVQLWGHDEDIRILSVGTGTTHNNSLDGEEAKKFGVIGWFTKGDLLGTLMSSSLVQKQAEVLLGDHFLRVNSNCSDYSVKSELDNWSKLNVLNLQRMGQGWWKKHGDQALDLICKPSSTPQTPLTKIPKCIS